jgi:hypothetical protein
MGSQYDSLGKDVTRHERSKKRGVRRQCDRVRYNVVEKSACMDSPRDGREWFLKVRITHEVSEYKVKKKVLWVDGLPSAEREMIQEVVIACVFVECGRRSALRGFFCVEVIERCLNVLLWDCAPVKNWL